jgi:hypothetical protein
MIRVVLGLVLLAFGLCVMAGGVYVGIWECLVGGIVSVIDQCKAPVTDSGTVAWAIVRIIFFEAPLVAGIWLGAFICAFGGYTLGITR